MYCLVGQVLREVDQAKYLGITISSELDWSPHISNISAKANNTLAFLRRNLKYCPRQLKENAYISLVRSQLEYSASIWDPYRVGDSNQLDRVQRRAAIFIFSDYSYHSSVTDMIHKLRWKDLATRRKELRLTLLYKMVHGLVAVPASDYLTPADKRTRALHPFNYRSIPCSTDSFKFSCIPGPYRTGIASLEPPWRHPPLIVLRAAWAQAPAPPPAYPAAAPPALRWPPAHSAVPSPQYNTPTGGASWVPDKTRQDESWTMPCVKYPRSSYASIMLRWHNTYIVYGVIMLGHGSGRDNIILVGFIFSSDKIQWTRIHQYSLASLEPL